MDRNRLSRDRDDDRGSRGRDRDEERSSRRGRDDEDRGSRRGRDDDRGGRSSGRRFEYQSRSASETKDRASKGNTDFDRILKAGVKMWKPNDGENRIRILPPTWDGARHFGLDVYVHYGVGPDRQSYLCPHKMQEAPCPICEEREQARRDEDEDYAKELEPKRRVLIYLIDRDHEKEGVQAWAMPWTLDRDIVKVSVDRQSGEVLPIDHPEEGYDVEFEKKGSKNRTEYLGVAIARRSTPLGRDEWLDFAMDSPLPEQLNYFDGEHIGKAFGGSCSHTSRRDRDDGGESERDGRSARDSRRDADDDRGGRSGRSRDDDDRNERRGSSARDDDRGDRGRSSRSSEPELTWESIHEMTGDELEDLIDQEKLDIDPKEAKDDEDLADWICEELKIEKATTRRRVTNDEESSSDRLRRMREGRKD